MLHNRDVAWKTRDAVGLWFISHQARTTPLYQSWRADPKLGGKNVKSWSSFSSQDQIFEGLIISSAPSSFHPCQVPPTAPPPTGCSRSQESSWTRIWIENRSRGFALGQPPKHLLEGCGKSQGPLQSWLQYGIEQFCRCLQKWRERRKQTFWFFDIRLWFRFSDKLPQVTDSSKCHLPEERRRKEPHGLQRKKLPVRKTKLTIVKTP